jgi:hypothetical protein
VVKDGRLWISRHRFESDRGYLQGQGFLQPPDDARVQYEFFAPFAHVAGRYEACRIRSPGHGVFDCLILLGASTAVPATVYVDSANGAAFMASRYPECTTVRLPAGAIALSESADGRTVRCVLSAQAGPVRAVDLAFRAAAGAVPAAVPYGGEGKPVWGSRWTCWGVDLALEGTCDGTVQRPDGTTEVLRGEPAIVTLGSFGRLAPITK